MDKNFMNAAIKLAIEPVITLKAGSAIKPEEKYNKEDDSSTINLEVSNKRLQEAIIWSEILGKPVSKRGKRR